MLSSLRTSFDGDLCEGFRMTADHDPDRGSPGPSSESRQGTNPRGIGEGGAGHAMGILARLARMALLMRWVADRLGSGAVAATGLGARDGTCAMPIRG